MDYSINWDMESPAPPLEESSGDILILEDKAWFGAGNTPASAPMNWWQYGYTLGDKSMERANAVYACRKVIAEEVSRLSAYHYAVDSAGGKVRLRSRLSRILRYPNTWQTGVDFWLNMVDSMLREGNAYAIAGYDETGAKSSLTQIRAAYPYVDLETNAVFYLMGWDGSTPLPEAVDVDPSQMVPARHIFHLRMFCPVNPLVGESPLLAAAVAANTSTAISNSSFQFFNRAARPSGYLRHPRRITKTARERLKDAWTRNYSGEGIGGTAVLEEGVEWNALTMNAVDAEIVEQYKLTVEDIARVYRVPLFMLGNMDKATFANVEQMTRSFFAGGLGFYVANIEAKVGQFFELPLDQGMAFDVEGGLLRTEFKDRVDALTKGVQGGVYTPNEARRREGLGEVPDGDEPLVQQQMVPLSYAANQTVPDPEPAPAEPEPESEPTEEETRAIVRRMLRVAA